MKKIIFGFLLGIFTFSLFADNIYVGESGGNRVGKYSSTGTLINASLITGLSNPRDIKYLPGGKLLVVSAGAGTSAASRVGLYTTSGSVLNASLTSLLDNTLFYWGAALVGTNLVALVQNTATSPAFGLTGNAVTSTNSSFLSTYTKYGGSIVTDGSYYYVNDTVLNHLQKFNLAGGVVSYSLAVLPSGASSMAVDGTNLYVVFYSANTVGKYTTSGQTVNSSLITGLQGPFSMAADGHGHLFVANYNSGTVDEYTTGGSLVKSNLIAGLSNPWGIAIETVPPSLSIAKSYGNVQVSWVTNANYFLQTNSDLGSTNWGPYTNFTTAIGTNVVNLDAPTNKLFFRLVSTNGG